ncbi:hypothetical protein K437DRAFT_257498 [Tilletiaria anomala UBC 951]|uniref:Uncharacterized protein n=1 Tax=Tilletiaria anomala (strain ATCC 24038 / CBS 436.72 / UBC 951) TaxID=1037660 RepID=A0A066VPQ3_TILAU|nr:uncharacterized protein K437DRAFT_257498 [Tilletiaria anomala UBC 951]KDN43436.1 hypothetical protein K437DRAFT_257498 [Tilletiaria anomala UBC 951]
MAMTPTAAPLPAAGSAAPSTPSITEKLAALRSRLEHAGEQGSASSRSHQAFTVQDDVLHKSPVKKQAQMSSMTAGDRRTRSALGEVTNATTSSIGHTVQRAALSTLHKSFSKDQGGLPLGKRPRAPRSPFIARILQQQEPALDSSTSPNPRAKKTGRVEEHSQGCGSKYERFASNQIASSLVESSQTSSNPGKRQARKFKSVDAAWKLSQFAGEDLSSNINESDLRTVKVDGGKKCSLRADSSFLREVKENGWDNMELGSPVRVRYVYGPPLKPRASTSIKKESKSEEKFVSKGRKSAPARTTAPSRTEDEVDQSLSIASSQVFNQSVRYSRKERSSTLPPPGKTEQMLSEAKQPDSPGDDPLLLKGAQLEKFAALHTANGLSVGEEQEEEGELGESSFTQETIERQRARSQSVHLSVTSAPFSTAVDSTAAKTYNWRADMEDGSDSDENALEDQNYNVLPPLINDELQAWAQAADASAIVEEGHQESSQEVSNGLIDPTPLASQDSQFRESQSASVLGEEDSGSRSHIRTQEAIGAEDSPQSQHNSDALDTFMEDSDAESEDSIELIGNSASRYRARSKTRQAPEHLQTDPSELVPEEETHWLDDGEGEGIIYHDDDQAVQQGSEGQEPRDDSQQHSEDHAQSEAMYEEVDTSMESAIVDKSIAAVPSVVNRAPSTVVIEDEGDEDEEEDAEPSTGSHDGCDSEHLRKPNAPLSVSDMSAFSTVGSNLDNMSAERSQMLSRLTPTPIVEVSSVDADAAARAAAILKHYHRYIEEGCLVETEVASASENQSLPHMLRREEQRLLAGAQHGTPHAPSATPACGALASINTPKPPGAFPVSPLVVASAHKHASVAIAPVSSLSWRKSDWSVLEKMLVKHIESNEAWVASRDNPSKAAAIRAIDSDEVVTAFLLSLGIQRSRLSIAGDWSEKAIRNKVDSLQRMLCRYAEDISPGTLQEDLRRSRRAGPPSEVGSDRSRMSSAVPDDSGLSMRPDNMAALSSVSTVAKAAARISLGAAFARGSHSTPIAAKATRLPGLQESCEGAAVPRKDLTKPKAGGISSSKPPCSALDLAQVKAGLMKTNDAIGGKERADELAEASTWCVVNELKTAMNGVERPRSLQPGDPVSAGILGFLRRNRASISGRVGDVATTSQANASMANSSISSIYPTLPGAIQVRTSQGGQSKVQATVLCTMGLNALKEAQTRSQDLAQSRVNGTWQSPLTLRKQQQQQMTRQQGHTTSELANGDVTFDNSKLFWQVKEKQ